MHVRKQPEKADGQGRLPNSSLRGAGAGARPVVEDMSPAAILALQRAVGNAAVLRMLDRQRRDAEEQPVQRLAVHDVLSSAGRPLDEPLRAEMEQRLDADFSDVRVHTDTEARRSAAEIGARAYTSGSHVVLGEDGADRHTMTHELVHVLQQRQGPVSGSDTGQGFRVSDPSDHFEREADAVATRALAQAPVSTTDLSDPASGGAHRSGRAEVQRASSQVADAMDLDSDEYGDPQDLEDLQTQKYNQTVSAICADLRGRGWQVNSTTKKGEEKETFTARKLDDSRKVKVADPRKIEGQERALTWLSTTVRAFLEINNKKPVEIQCAVHGGKFYIASNDAGCNNWLRGRVDQFEGNLKKWLESIAKGVSKSLGEGAEPKGLPDKPGEETKRAAELERLKEHSGKAATMLESLGGEYPDILKAMGNTVTVSKEVPGEESRGVHAEKRILELTGNVTPTMIGGTRRSCLTCYLDLYPDGGGTGRPGHLYSAELMRDVDVLSQDAGSIVRTLLERMERSGVQFTYRTGYKDPKVPSTERHGSVSD